METTPWAEPGCTGLKKRRAHSPYNSFANVAHALDYWKRFEDNGRKVKSCPAESIAEGQQSGGEAEEEEEEGWRLSPDASLCLASGRDGCGMLFGWEAAKRMHRRRRWAPSFYLVIRTRILLSYLYRCWSAGRYKRWKFAISNRPEGVPHGFQSPSFDDSAWMDIELPVSWQCLWTPEGEIDPPIYTNMNYPFESTSPKPPDNNPTACFRLTFQWVSFTIFFRQNFSALETCHGTWHSSQEKPEGKSKNFLIFEGVESSIVCYLNDSFVGFSQDSRLPAEFDISDKLVEGANTIACVVPRFSSGRFESVLDSLL